MMNLTCGNRLQSLPGTGNGSPGLGLLTAVAALIVSLLMSPTYEATTLIAATRPQYQLQFDHAHPDRDRSHDSHNHTRHSPSLALSDEVLSRVIAKVGGLLTDDQHDVDVFQRRLSARAGADPSLIRLTASANDPQVAQAIAAAWGEVYVQYVNDLYQQRTSTATFFATQTDEAARQSGAAEQKLIDLPGAQSAERGQCSAGGQAGGAGQRPGDGAEDRAVDRGRPQSTAAVRPGKRAAGNLPLADQSVGAVSASQHPDRARRGADSTAGEQRGRTGTAR